MQERENHAASSGNSSRTRSPGWLSASSTVMPKYARCPVAGGMGFSCQALPGAPESSFWKESLPPAKPVNWGKLPVRADSHWCGAAFRRLVLCRPIYTGKRRRPVKAGLTSG